ncbi:MAG: hypothetical protein ACKESB_00185 [Candidatus Hodgkinia cicadicola]
MQLPSVVAFLVLCFLSLWESIRMDSVLDRGNSSDIDAASMTFRG